MPFTKQTCLTQSRNALHQIEMLFTELDWMGWSGLDELDCMWTGLSGLLVDWTAWAALDWIGNGYGSGTGTGLPVDWIVWTGLDWNGLNWTGNPAN